LRRDIESEEYVSSESVAIERAIRKLEIDREY